MTKSETYTLTHILSSLPFTYTLIRDLRVIYDQEEDERKEGHVFYS